jgi:hypothetical protein
MPQVKDFLIPLLAALHPNFELDYTESNFYSRIFFVNRQKRFTLAIVSS